MLPPLLPLFPLPTTVLFPGVFLPLHIFEPRYKQMVARALEGDRIIGMTLVVPGQEDDDEGRPDIFPVGCAGLITHVERQNDGGFNLILRGLDKFRITEEEPPTDGVLYRIAHITPIEEDIAPSAREALAGARRRLETLLAPSLQGEGGSRLPRDMADPDLVNALSQYLELEPVEKQALLERNGVLARCQTLVELIEMKLLMQRQPDSGLRH
ncbi:MAG: LON peptidase substrate-binding domain-containing protein [Acidobacteria bacterium]|nr:LON peptidase substrate-binding domain-containing protein [Acidobacteriota bacterium]